MKSSNQKQKHPNQRQLERFLQGDLSAKNQAVVERHLEKCSECISRLENVEGDTLGDRLLEVGTFFNQALDPSNDKSLAPLLNHDRYELIERLGSGGMGDVYRANQRSMDRPVAIKVLKQSLFENDRAVARFHNEIKVAAKLNHPNIVHSYDAEVSNGLNILVMELVEGDKLSDVVNDEGPFRTRKATDIARQIADGLDYASRQGMIHRDIKPQNIMLLPDGNVKITDFGLAKFVLTKTDDKDGSLTLEGEVFGTPDYIAPEQIRDSGSADARSDIYSLGCTLYFLLSGHPPFAGFSVGEKLAGHLEKKASPLAEVRQGLDQELVAAIEKMMHKDPAHRFQSYVEVKEALSRIDGELAEEVPLNVSHNPVSENQQRGGGLTRRLAIFGGLPAVLLGLWFGGLLPNPFSSFSSSPAPANPRTGNIKFAIVIPSRNAFHPELQEISKSLGGLENVELEFIADQVGPVNFKMRKRNAEPSVISVVRTLEDTKPSEFDAVIFTGGWDGDSAESTVYAFDPALNEQAKAFCERMLQSRKPIGSICGGTIVLANTGLIRGKNVANCRYLSAETRTSSGANWTEVPKRDDLAVAISDDLLVTGGNYRNTPEVIRMMFKLAKASRTAIEK